MTAVVFSGPTISPSEVAEHIDAVCLPPVSQGDIYRALDHQPRAIGIIDGYFQGVPSAWHKEILWALGQGVHVYGSASMGALRAAELHQMGMIGVGRIFADYAAGTLEDDDEVAVLHGPAEMGFKPLGEPMVNVRATLDKAVSEAIIDEITATGLCKTAKAMFYKERTWTRLLDGMDMATDLRAAFKGWLVKGYVDQKRADAQAMLVEMVRQLRGAVTTPEINFDFENTLVWQRLTECSARSHCDEIQQVLDELRLQPDRYEHLCAQAQLRYLAFETANRLATEPDRAAHRQAITSLRERHNLFTRAQLDDWLSGNQLNQREFENLAGQEARLAIVLDDIIDNLDAELTAVLQLQGEFGTLQQRACQKVAALDGLNLSGDLVKETGLLPIQLAEWYFVEQLNSAIPEQLAGYARSYGFGDLSSFYNCMAGEYLYLTRDKK